jgi:hypothetical protein
MVQHLLLIMVAMPLLIVGRPITLLLHAVRNPWYTRVKRFIRSRPITALTWPPAGVVLYSAAVLGTHLTGLLLARGAVHDGEHVAYLAAGTCTSCPSSGRSRLGGGCPSSAGTCCCSWRCPPTSAPARY